MTNEELTELCTRVATKVLGWSLYEGDYLLPKWHKGSETIHHPNFQEPLEEVEINILISPWGRDLVEKAMEEMGFEWNSCCSVYKQGKLKIYDYEFGNKGEFNHEDKNIACLLAADKAVSDEA